MLNFWANTDLISKVEEHLSQQSIQIKELIPIFNLDDFYFAGGCIYSIWNDKTINDYDIFCRNKKALSKLKTFFKNNPHLINCKTKNATTCGKLQFVTRYVGDPEVEVAKFDFKHNCYWYDSHGLHATYDWEFLNSPKLEFNTKRARDVLNILTRIPKFMKRGMDIDCTEILKIIETGTKPSKIISERRSIKERRNWEAGY